MLLLYTYLLGHFAMRQTELRLAIWLSHPVLFHYTKERTLFILYRYVYSFVRSFKSTNDSSSGQRISHTLLKNILF